METLRQTLKTLFLHKNPDTILDELYSEACPKSVDGYSDCCIDKNWFIAAFNNDEDCYYTKDQINNYYNLVKSKWMKANDERTLFSFSRKPSVFNVLLHFAAETLTISDYSYPVCKYDSLLRWHDISAQLTEDLFCTAFLASRDLRDMRHYENHRTFLWKDTIDHDNAMLNQIYKKRMVDVHYHLWGSTFVFELNWLSLMNDVTCRRDDFKKIEEYLVPLHTLFQVEKHSTLYLLTMKAAAIRLCLYYHLSAKAKSICDDVDRITEQILVANTDLMMTSALEELKDLVQSTRYRYGKKIPKSRYAEKQVWDYAIDDSIDHPDKDASPFFVLTGERSLMYRTFKKIYSGSKGFINTKLPALFYVYILIKNIFRHELVQLNNYVGFKNFSDYQDRKSVFIRKSSVWEEMAAECAIGSSLFGDRDRYVEARITPKKDIFELYNSTMDINKSIHDRYSGRYGFVMHFIKKEDKSKGNGVSRHQDLRCLIKQQALAIYQLHNMPGIPQNIIGIDAASSEIVCPPEVFAPAYRFLRNKTQGYSNPYETTKNVRRLHFTYHVGEDFLDIVSGLRAIEETILFLGMTNGDRLGHALVLGTDVDKYYENRHYLISMPQHEILDNVVWLIKEAEGMVGYDKVHQKLQGAFEKYRRLIYGTDYGERRKVTNDMSKYSVDDFYQAWLLRGDNPSLYRQSIEPKDDFYEGILSLTSRNDNPRCSKARENENARQLFWFYHFSETAKHNGKITDEIELPKELIGIIKELQEQILHDVERRHIAIESNPTSNYRIGEMDYYKEHPMLHFYNHGIDHGEIKDHTISLSINTDDKGVFATSQEREFSVMACALEKLYQHGDTKNPPRVIYEWLDNIRKMGFEQTFLKV